MSDDLHLHDAANTFDIPPGDVDAVVSRARSRTQRRRALMATVTTIAVVSGAVSFIGTRGDDGDGGSTHIAAEVGGNASLGADQFTWTRTETAKGLSWTPVISGSGQLYALSTGPGERRFEDARQNGHVYRSADGVDWQSVSRLGNDMFLSDLAPASERLYAVGTGPATAAVAGRTTRASDLIAGWSDDGGEHWSKAVLPFDMKAVAAKSITTSVTDTEVATGPKGTLVVAAVRALLDVPALLPDGATAPYGWDTTLNGIDVLGRKRADVCPEGATADKGSPDSPTPAEVDPTYCFNENEPGRSKGSTVVPPQEARGVTASYTWEQLGVSGDVLRAARGELIAFFAEPGSADFARVDVGSIPVGAPLFTIAAEDGFDIIKSSAPSSKGERSRMSVLHSPDGRTFTPVSSDPAMAYASYAGMLGATPVVLGGTEEGKPVMLRRTGDGWTSTDLSKLVTRPANTEIYMGMAGVGPAGAAVSVMIQEVETRDGGREDRGQPVTALLTTRDGVAWHSRSLDELAGRTGGNVGLIAVTGDRLVITAVMPKTDNNSEVAPRLTLIGTPR